MNEPSTERDSSPNVEATTTETATKQEVKQHRSRPLLVGGLALFIAILGGVATLAVYKNYFEKPQPSATNSQATVTKPVEKKNVSKDILTLLSSQISAGEVMYDGVAPGYKPAGYDFAVAPSKSPALHVTRSAVDSRTTSATIASFFKGRSYAEKVVATNADSSLAITEYSAGDAKCVLNQSYNDINDTVNAVRIDVICRDTGDYTTTANTLMPFYTAYRASASAANGTVLLYDPTIKQSKTSGYKIAEAGVGTYGELTGGAMGLFYMTPDNSWHFFKATQELPPCSMYNTTDLKKAYVGTQCYDIPANKEGFVKL